MTKMLSKRGTIYNESSWGISLSADAIASSCLVGGRIISKYRSCCKIKKSHDIKIYVGVNLDGAAKITIAALKKKIIPVPTLVRVATTADGPAVRQIERKLEI